MKRVKLNKTITIGGDDPYATFCYGHISEYDFNRASSREGWNGKDGLEIPESELIRGFYIKNRKKNKSLFRLYKSIDQVPKGMKAKKCTYATWW